MVYNVKLVVELIVESDNRGTALAEAKAIIDTYIPHWSQVSKAEIVSEREDD